MVTRIVAVFVAVLAIGAQRPPTHYVCDANSPKALCPDGTDANLPEFERAIPPGDYCKARGVRILPSETRAHVCDCKMACDINGDPMEGAGCLANCHKNRRACTFHIEEPCPGSLHAGQGYVDMDGHVIAVARRH